jgi:hypothetical protein
VWGVFAAYTGVPGNLSEKSSRYFDRKDQTPEIGGTL